MHIHMIKHHPLSALDEHLSHLIDRKKNPKRHLYESMSDWAAREVALACKKEDGYGASCYQSALKAFRSLCDDGHSCFSIGISKVILNRLIDGKPLTPIEDTPDVWIKYGLDNGKAIYQNSRMSGLFKEVCPDGTTTFNDIDRATLIEVADDGTETSWYSGLASDLVNKIIGPISFPYYPVSKPYKVYAKQFDSVNAACGCYDTTHVIKIVDPDGNEIPRELYYAETTDSMEEISKEEYLRREQSYKAALKAGKPK